LVVCLISGTASIFWFEILEASGCGGTVLQVNGEKARGMFQHHQSGSLPDWKQTMVKKILTVLVIGYVIFELIERILFPLVCSFAAHNRKCFCGNEGMPGKEGEVRCWQRGV
jgi:hypothetical protein